MEVDFLAGLNNIPGWLWTAIVIAVIWVIKPWKKKM